jgi:Pentapeptide repeats (8 copies)
MFTSNFIVSEAAISCKGSAWRAAAGLPRHNASGKESGRQARTLLLMKPSTFRSQRATSGGRQYPLLTCEQRAEFSAVNWISGTRLGAMPELTEPMGSTRSRDACLQRTNLVRADLRRADLRYADLWSAKLVQADLRGADLRDSFLMGARLTHANLEGANLEGARLSCADLRYALLSGANLKRVSLGHARLEGASLNATSLDGADLQGVDLRGVALLTASIRGAFYGQYTLWPPGFDPEQHGAVRAW